MHESKVRVKFLPWSMSMEFRNITVCENMMSHSCPRLLCNHGYHCSDNIGMLTGLLFSGRPSEDCLYLCKSSTDQQERHATGQIIV